MFVIIQEDKVGYEDGYSVAEVFGPFPDRPAADAFLKEIEKYDFYGQDYSVRELTPQIPGWWANFRRPK